MDKRETFIKKAKLKHGEKYDYSKVEYVDSKTKVCIICPEHGEFWQTPAAHVRGNSCPKCANNKRGDTFRLTQDEFIKKARNIHGNKYDYSKVRYKNASTEVEIICSKHGSFFQTPMLHMYGHGCPKCAGRGLSREESMKRFREVHGNKYDYSESNIGKYSEKIKIICPEHGEFWQTPSKHLMGEGCPECSKHLRGVNTRMTKEEFLQRAKEIHGDKYDYSLVEFYNTYTKVKIKCPNHGVFEQFPYDHINGHGCPKCALQISNGEDTIYKFLCEKLGKDKVVRRERGILENRKEIDIFIPDLKIGIEYNGLYWHSEDGGKNKWYHYDKTTLAEKNGIRLIQIFEDELKDKPDIVFSKLSYLIGKNDNLPKLSARNCRITEIDYKTAKAFLNENHIQGAAKSTIYLGAFFLNTMVGVMSFIREKDDRWILNRFAVENKFICRGIGGKLFKYFTRHYRAVEVKSFADRRWTTDKENNFYIKVGFKLVSLSSPEYRYISKTNPTERIHKFNFRKKEVCRKYHLPYEMTESEMVKKIGLTKIWDCGLYKYVWKKQD